MSNKIPVYIEIERGSNIKYEYNKESDQLEVDRILAHPHVYPHAYGFIPNTLAPDGDELDALILCDTELRNDATYDAYIIGALRMEDENGMDEKVLCTLVDSDLESVESSVLAAIETFFASYKIGCPDKWSRTFGFMGKEEAIELYKRCREVSYASGSLALS
jgi:inorganic pyrophosphatase